MWKTWSALENSDRRKRRNSLCILEKPPVSEMTAAFVRMLSVAEGTWILPLQQLFQNAMDEQRVHVPGGMIDVIGQ